MAESSSDASLEWLGAMMESSSDTSEEFLDAVAEPASEVFEEFLCIRMKPSSEASVEDVGAVESSSEASEEFLPAMEETSSEASEEFLRTMAAFSAETSEELLNTSEATEDSPKSLEQKKPAGRRRRRRPTFNSFAIYFPKVLNKIHQDLSLSKQTVRILDSFVQDMFERISQEASVLVRSNKRATMTSRDIQTAVRLLLSGKRGKHAVAQGTKAVLRYQRK